MMHPLFFHWHPGIKTDSALLEPRWNAAAKFVEKTTSADICSLLGLVFDQECPSELTARFTAALVAADPTFPPEKNVQLLRVMAAAALHAKMENMTSTSSAIALGLQSANFPEGRVSPICNDITKRGSEFLALMGENVRPKLHLGTLDESEKKAGSQMAILKEAITTADQAKIASATEAYCKTVLSSMKESHNQLGKVFGRINEENQFLWWLIGRRSPTLDIRRENVSPEVYAIPAATEAAQRVILLPPPACVEAILDEVLAQCLPSTKGPATVINLIDSIDASFLEHNEFDSPAPNLTPLTYLTAERKRTNKVATSSLAKLNIPSKARFTPLQISRQYFREKLFLRALSEF